MVIHDLHVVGVIVSPVETDPPLIVNPDAMLALSVTRKRLESVPGRDFEIPQRHRRIQRVEYRLRLSLDFRWEFLGAFPPKYLFGLPALEGLDPGRILTQGVINLKRY
jgi:hypothetical protein